MSLNDIIVSYDEKLEKIELALEDIDSDNVPDETMDEIRSTITQVQELKEAIGETLNDMSDELEFMEAAATWIDSKR